MLTLSATFGQNMNVMTVVHVLFIIYGAYSLVTAGKMKKDHQISQWLVAANDLPRIRDQKGFCEEMAPLTYFFGGACVGYGLLSMLNTYLIDNRWLHLVILLAFFVSIVIYVTRLHSAKKKYIY